MGCWFTATLAPLGSKRFQTIMHNQAFHFDWCDHVPACYHVAEFSHKHEKLWYIAQVYISHCICLIEWIHNFSEFFCLVFFSLVLLFPFNTDIFFVLVWASKVTAPVSYFLKIHFWTVTYQKLLLSPHNHNFSISVSNDLMVWWMTPWTSE